MRIPSGPLFPNKAYNFKDHIAFSPAYAVRVTTHSQLAYAPFAAAQTADYIANRTGILTNTGGDILGFTQGKI